MLGRESCKKRKIQKFLLGPETALTVQLRPKYYISSYWTPRQKLIVQLVVDFYKAKEWRNKKRACHEVLVNFTALRHVFGFHAQSGNFYSTRRHHIHVYFVNVQAQWLLSASITSNIRQITVGFAATESVDTNLPRTYWET